MFANTKPKTAASSTSCLSADSKQTTYPLVGHLKGDAKQLQSLGYVMSLDIEFAVIHFQNIFVENKGKVNPPGETNVREYVLKINRII